MSHTVTLLQFEYAWEVQAYLRFANIIFEERNAEYASVDLTGELPQLRIDNVFLEKKEIFSYMKQNGFNLDAEFPQETLNEITTYTYMLHHYANPSYNCYKLTKSKLIYNHLSSIYSSVLSFPYNHLYYNKQKKQVDRLMGLVISKDQKERNTMLDDLYRVLNEKLYESASKFPNEPVQFLFGSKPSSLDAVLFGHLATVMEFPAGMQNNLLCYPGLVNFYENIMKYYFSAARGEKVSDNLFLKQYGLHIACQPSKQKDRVLPYKDKAPRIFDNLDSSEEDNQNEVDTKKSAEEKLEMREQFVYYGCIGLLIFAGVMIVDLF